MKQARKKKPISEHADCGMNRMRIAEYSISDFGFRNLDFFSALHILQSTIEMRDPYTAVHQRRVADLASAIAMEMDLSEDQIHGIRMAGFIHDLGKIYVPIDILNKPGRLTEIEYNLIKTHPRVGYDILKPMGFPWPVAQIVLQHHERMDGSGYPSGLSGEEILLEARILTVSDVVEAMASDRPYKCALGIEKVIEEISKNKGILYDPRVVNACLRLFIEKGFPFDKESNFNQQPVSTFSHCDLRYTQAVQKP